MKTLYTLEVTWYNGTVTMGNEITCYTDRGLAEKVKEAVEKANPPQEEKYTIIERDGTHNVRTNMVSPILCRIKETKVYESEDEVPILNTKD